MLIVKKNAIKHDRPSGKQLSKETKQEAKQTMRAPALPDTLTHSPDGAHKPREHRRELIKFARPSRGGGERKT